MFHRQSTNNLPGWLWFFLILPITLILALLYKRQRLPAVLQQRLAEKLQRVTHKPPLYSEPDSIPLDMSDVHPAAVPFDSQLSQAVAPAAMIDEALDSERASQPPAGETADDLKVIEGIGPAIAGLLREHNIHSFSELARTPVARLQEILAAARLSRLSDPTTWPEQAGLAAEGRWESLNEMQRSLKAGRRKQT